MTSEAWVRATAWTSGALYAVTILCWMLRREWRSSPVLRLVWTLSWLIFLIHVALAFEVYHHWSHDAAWEHTQHQSGVGDGIYFNYAVILVWTLWMVWFIHGFLLFMWLNAAVLFPLIKGWS
jgi:hypothetical protein